LWSLPKAAGQITEGTRRIERIAKPNVVKNATWICIRESSFLGPLPPLATTTAPTSQCVAKQAQSLCVDSGILYTMPVTVQLFIPAVDRADAP
jgi:hypothetical protein